MDITNNSAVTKTVWLIVAIVLIAITSFFGFKMSFADEGNINIGNEESSLSDKEEADAKLENFQKRPEKWTGHKHHKKPWTIEDLKTKLQNAVDNGKLTQEEADAKLENFQKRPEKWTGHKHHKIFIPVKPS